ncbi:hypothetical protein NQ315_003892 [Exocentrus adspersus]|uniref:Uncharacterized protein n=1 Tax=Exocentrus adspersus TaxID=1586481 RepID=A0AAV8VYM9_9CUCU|nr:hypothetical protein NQ315_003892 [Exocentrus adspersus]
MSVQLDFLDHVLHSRDRNKIYLVAICHLVMVGYSICSLVLEMIDLQEPVTTYEILYIGIHYTIHFILIFCLIVGVYIDIPFFLVPWLSAAFFIYFYVTILTVISMEPNIIILNIIAHLKNFLVLSVCWFSWYVVFSYAKNEITGRGSYERCLLE